jgi:hypothetical protein
LQKSPGSGSPLDAAARRTTSPSVFKAIQWPSKDAVSVFNSHPQKSSFFTKKIISFSLPATWL